MTTTRTEIHAPVAYLVAERRGGQWIIGDDWNHRCDTLDEARKVADEWRSYGRSDPGDIAVLAVTVVPEIIDHDPIPAGVARVCAICGAPVEQRPDGWTHKR
ncbi:MAG TPA: hypothetical protein VFY84_14175 [Jiangellales bacterium]|nr:hypothetical protein [Jiangellales bacterium]